MGCGASAKYSETPKEDEAQTVDVAPEAEAPPKPADLVWGAELPAGARWQYFLQIKESWTDSGDEEDAALKAAYIAGESTVRYSSYGVEFEASFPWMRRFNLSSKKARPLRLVDVNGIPFRVLDADEPPTVEEQPSLERLDTQACQAPAVGCVLARAISAPVPTLPLDAPQPPDLGRLITQDVFASRRRGAAGDEPCGWGELQKKLTEENKECEEELQRLLREYPDVVCVLHPGRSSLRVARKAANGGDYAECLSLLRKVSAICEEERQAVMTAFLRHDSDGDFHLTVDEIRQLCDELACDRADASDAQGSAKAQVVAEGLIQEATTGPDGGVSLESFSQWVAKHGGARQLGLGVMELQSSACPSCGHSFLQLPGEVVDIEGHRLPRGAVMTREDALVHAAANRLRCPGCAENWCIGCDATPYHFGMDCLTWAEMAERKHTCRFCGTAVPPGLMACGSEEGSDPLGMPPVLSCADKECRSCTQSCPCGHPCGGVLGEETCLPCLMEGCHGADAADADDYCNICWVEALGAAPCVQMACGHAFHHHCISAVIAGAYVPGKALNFRGIQCPLCKELFQNAILEGALEEHVGRYREVRRLAILRHREERRPGYEEDDDAVAEIAMAKMRFFLCSRCSKPYYGGEAACGEGAAELEEEVVAGVAEDEFVCSACLGGQRGESTCEIHGTDFIGWKCKWCCEFESLFFCGGHTHFCDRCHRWGWGAKDHHEVRVCKGGENCIFGGNHPPDCPENGVGGNGEGEYPLGCVVCVRSGQS